MRPTQGPWQEAVWPVRGISPHRGTGRATLCPVRFLTVLPFLAFAVQGLLGCSSVSRADASTNESSGARRLSDALIPSVHAATLTHGPVAQALQAGDADGDGIDDETELALAKRYFPYYAQNPEETCGRHGVLFRLAPHPADKTKVAIWYVVLFERDCGRFGIGAHVGDDEVFGEIVDVNRPAPEGILAIRAISHQDTRCERVSSCGSLPGCEPCATATKDGQPYPVVFSSRSKHGTYTSATTCNRWICDFGLCEMNGVADSPVFVNAGEPGHPLSKDLSSEGFINAANGWTESELMHFDPWGNQRFGHAGNVTDDLTDTSFLISPTGC